MTQKKQIRNIVASLVFIMALMLPTAVEFIHMFEGHELTSCEEQRTHVHEFEAKCKICSFHLVSFDYDLDKYPDLLLSEIFIELESDLTSLQLHSYKITNTQLRAPPVFS